MSSPVFDTNYARNNQETLRWASVAIAGFFTVLCLIWAAMVFHKDRFNQDAAYTIEYSRTVEQSSMNYAFRMLMIAFFFMVTVASSFLSWYIASLHMSKNNLIALDVLNVVTVICLGLAAYFYYKNTRRNDATSRSFLGSACVLEFVALIVLLVSPTAAGSNGTLTQSALAIPLLVATFVMLSNLGRFGSGTVVGPVPVAVVG